MAIPRQFIIIAASAAVAGLYLYARNRPRGPGAGREKRTGRATPTPAKPGEDVSPAPRASDGSAQNTAAPVVEPPGGAVKDLAMFLAGETWLDEVGWQAIWEREGVGAPDVWLRSTGRKVLSAERTKLAESPALLAGCRRRWIVVCRYGGIDVSDAASLWNAGA